MPSDLLSRTILNLFVRNCFAWLTRVSTGSTSGHGGPLNAREVCGMRTFSSKHAAIRLVNRLQDLCERNLLA